MKKEETGLVLAYNRYIDEYMDLSCNPKYEDLENEEIEPLFEKNNKEYLTALKENEGETAKFLSGCSSYPQCEEFAEAVFLHFKSERIYSAIERHFERCAETCLQHIVDQNKQILDRMRAVLDSASQ